MPTELHPDFPDAPDRGTCHRWELPVPLSDLAEALGSGFWDLAEVTDYSIKYHEVEWTPGDGGGTELTLIVIARTLDSRWLGVEAWNDYTGWGCQDGTDVYVGTSRDDVIANGITNDGRSALGLPLA